MRKLLFIVLGLLIFAYGLNAQGFGKNKPRYKKIEFEVLETPDFEIHHYLKNDSALYNIANWTQHWYQLHQNVLKDTFKNKNPLVLYNNHADFQQTSVIQSTLGVGTGGVTEGLRNRVVFPFAMTNQQTHHVLGHELVHAFQYHRLIHSDTSLSIRNIQNLPLWMVEGLAEYLSIGRTDVHTAMWMRDAVLQDDVPAIKDLSKPKYFPYRYGQAFWAFVTGVYGDEIIEPLFVNTAKYGLKTAIDSTLNISQENLSNMWQSSLKTWAKPLVEDRQDLGHGRKILDGKNSGEMNLSPVLSPNGKYLVFLSEKDLFSLDLFLADARSGKIIQKIGSTLRDGHLDHINFMESTGAWAPDNTMFAFVAFKKGENVLVIKDIENGKTVEEIKIPGVPAFSNPAWAPNGRDIVVSGLVQGQVDLYVLDWQRKTVRQLTDDAYAELHPQWSVDGAYLVYATDEKSMLNGRTNGRWAFNLALYHFATGEVKHLDIFPGADNLNPVFDQEGNIWFLSNRDGFRNLYKYNLSKDQVYQQTDLLTGISGITHYAPAISIGGKLNRIVYSYYRDGKYSIYQGRPDRFLNKPVDKNEVDFSAAMLPPIIKSKKDLVNTQLHNLDQMAEFPDSSFIRKKYESKLGLEYIGGGAGIGVSNQTFGTSTMMQGGIDMLFGDMLGENKLYAGIALNGEIYDFAGQLTYLNQKNKIGWGASISHIPYRTGRMAYLGRDTLQVQEDLGILTNKYYLDIYRLFEEKASVFGQLALSRSKRLEAGASFSWLHYRLDRFTNYYDDFGRLIYQDRDRIPAPDALGFATLSTAFVHDNSYFGIAAPLQGNRYRIGIEKYVGDLDFYSLLADYRQYVYIKPFSFAFRAMHLGRYGKDADAFAPIYLGYPWFIRGYEFNSTDILSKNGISINQLAGNQALVGNFEIRIPFTGPERLSLIKSKMLFTDLNFFVDGGVAWNNQFDQPSQEGKGLFGDDIQPVFSAGASIRLNLFGAMVLEPYWAVPLLDQTRVVFGLNIVPGW